MKQAWKTAVMTAVATAAMGTTMACAQYDQVKSIKYEYFQNPIYDPVYEIAWKAMAPLYKGTEYEFGAKNINPSIDIAQVDLNGDRLPEIISTPVESSDETAELCPGDGNCPFYVFVVRDKAVHSLLKVNAYAIDMGDDIKNGYWTLKVLVADAKAKDGRKELIYAYDKKADGYVLQPSSVSSIIPKPTSSPKPSPSSP